MRSTVLAAALAALPLVAMAQTYPSAAPQAPADHNWSASDQGRSQSAMNQQPNPENCGTPDEPKACPPLPRHPLNYYPPNRQ